MEENKNNTTQQQERGHNPMSPFCEALMDATQPLNVLKQPDDSAIVICTDGHTVATRTLGNMGNAVGMITSKMLDNGSFATVIMEAATRYSMIRLKREGVLVPNEGVDDATEDTATIQPLN